MRTRHLILPTLLLTLAACGPTLVEDAPEGDLPEADEFGKADAAGTLTITPLWWSLPAAAVDRGGLHVFRTADDFRAWFGFTPTGFNFSTEWVVFFSPGRAFRNSAAWAQLRQPTTRRLVVIGRTQSPGGDCVTFPGLPTPYYLGRFRPAIPSYVNSIEYHNDPTIYSCGTGPIDLSCAFASCGAGRVCRLVDGRGTCVAAPPTCDFVVCPTGQVCRLGGDRASCIAAAADGPTVSFPGEGGPSIVVSFPPARPPSVCKDIRCGSGTACSVSRRTGRGVCVSTAPEGGRGWN